MEINNEFKTWLTMVDELAIARGYTETSYTEQTGVKYWFGYFEDGYSPEDAYAKDYSRD